MQPNSKRIDLMLITLMYAVSIAVGGAAFLWHPIIPEYLAELGVSTLMARLFAFDIIATIAIFVCSVMWRNSSIYDAYWSFVPLLMVVWLYIHEGVLTQPVSINSLWQAAFLIVFCLWAVRLTLNWVEVTSGLDWEDWRYRYFRDNNDPVVWQLLNFTGIHMMPTLIVFAGMLPIFVIIHSTLTAWSLIGVAVMLGGIALEYFADKQMHAFLSRPDAAKGALCQAGLWRYSRHPNYLGEISLWAGVYITMLTAAPERWYYGIGAAAMVVLFNVVSIPMMEKRQMLRRPAYAEYRRTTSRLLLLPPRK